MEELLTVKEAAERLRLNEQTIRNYIDRGQLAAVRVGQRRVRIRQPDLEAFAASGRTGPRKGQAPAPKADAAPSDAHLWHDLGTALTESTAALADDDRAELVRTLNALAEAAGRLADALAPER